MGVRDGGVDLGEGPEHAPADLIAERDKCERDVGGAKCLQSIGNICAETSLERCEVGGGPGGRRDLMLRVSPGIGEVKVEVD